MESFRQNQLECIKAIDKHLLDHDRALIKMFCGSGKSLIIYNCIMKYSINLSVIVVPSINLITQFNKNYLSAINNNYKLLTICSKNELDNNYSFTTDENTIKKFLKNKNNKIILITYQSLKILFDVIKNNSFIIDILCFDEAHHILGDGMKNILFKQSYLDDEDSDDENSDEDENEDENEDYNYDEDIDEYNENNFLTEYVKKTLFFTATPKNSNGIKMYEPIIGIEINDEIYEFTDDNNSVILDKVHCGDTIYEYMHLNGVNDNILNDFNVRVDLYTENTDKSIFEAISRSIIETGNNRVLTFHSRSEISSEINSDVLTFIKKSNVELFKQCFSNILKNEFPNLINKYKKITFTGITSKTKDKINILNEFDNTEDNEIYILASCKTIGEGIDTKNANMLVFVDPKQSFIEIIQNIGRICRKNVNTKNLATVLIPCYIDVSKYKNSTTSDEKDKIIRSEMSKTGNFNGILNVLSALRLEDPYIFELCLKYPEIYTEKEINDNLKKNGLSCLNQTYNATELFNEYDLKFSNNKTEIENFTKLSKKIDKNIQIINDKILLDDIYIDNGHKLTECFIKKDDNLYCKTKGNLTNKLKKPNRNIKPFVHANDEIKVLWNIDSDLNLNKKIFGGYIKSTVIIDNEEQWKEKLNKLKDYIDTNNKRPSIHDKNKEIKTIGSWLSRQMCTYKKKVHLMKGNKIRKLWEDFINDDKYKKYFETTEQIWKNKLNEVKRYIDTNNKRPSTVDKNQEIKIIGIWLNVQKTNYDKNKYIIKDESIRKLWKDFINDDKYKKYLSNKQLWINKLNEVKNYINENNKRPSREDKKQEIKILSQWLSGQKKNYDKNEQIMKDESIRKLWEDFINDIKYKKYFENNEQIWINKLNEIKNYINENNKRPSSEDKNHEIKILGNWLIEQKKNYNKNEQIMKNESIKKLWEDFINDDKYKKYFKINKQLWKNKLNEVKNYIDLNNKLPSQRDKNQEIKILGNWLHKQTTNYNKNKNIMKDESIRKLWTDFIDDNKYKKYFESNEQMWTNKLNEIKKYINENNKLPSTVDKNQEIKIIGNWLNNQKTNYDKNEQIMKEEQIRKLYEDFINDVKYKKYFDKIVKKSTTINIPKEEKNIISNKTRILSDYQEITKKMSIQNSKTTNQMFKDDNTLWQEYHDNRDHSFKGYDNQDEIPVNKIIAYLKTKITRKLNILDLGCGRNLIKKHFISNNNFNIKGYDHISCNDSFSCDISNLPEENETIDICIYSQSLMGSNWKDYIIEAKRILKYNGEMIISESVERYDIIVEYIKSLQLHIKKTDYIETNRWFYIFVIND